MNLASPSVPEPCVPKPCVLKPEKPTTMSDNQPQARQSIEASFRASDGQKIFYRYWKPGVESDNAMLMFHRGHEHSARWQDFVDTSELNDCWFFAWDARGHGRTEGERGAAESFGRLVRDADEFAKHVCDTYGLVLENFGVVGQSVGAVLAATWVHDYAPPVRAMVIATPALRIKLYVPLAIPGLRLLNKIRPGTFIKSYVRPGMLTHDQEQADSYANDSTRVASDRNQYSARSSRHFDATNRRRRSHPHADLDVRIRQRLRGSPGCSRKVLRRTIQSRQANESVGQFFSQHVL